MVDRLLPKDDCEYITYHSKIIPLILQKICISMSLPVNNEKRHIIMDQRCMFAHALDNEYY